MLRGCGKLWGAISHFLATRSSQMNVDAANDVDPKYYTNLAPSSVYKSVCETWIGIVWAFTLIFVWFWSQIRVGEWCYEAVGSCEVWQVLGCDFLLPRNSIKSSLCVCVVSSGFCRASFSSALLRYQYHSQHWPCVPTFLSPKQESASSFRFHSRSVHLTLLMFYTVTY